MSPGKSLLHFAKGLYCQSATSHAARAMQHRDLENDAKHQNISSLFICFQRLVHPSTLEILD
jgi:hypothetical protein